jgi:hypothetical protein
MISKLLPHLLAVLTAGILASCASSGSGTNPDGTPKDEHSVNTLPWNKPASWEGGGTIPGMGGAR